MYIRLRNVFDSKITSSAFDKVYLITLYHPPLVCYNELHHYSLTLTNVNRTNGFFKYGIDHGTSYNVSVIFDNVNIISSSESDYGVYYYFTESLFSLYITNSSVSYSYRGFEFNFDNSDQSKYCDIKGVESWSTIVIEDSLFHNNGIYGFYFGILRDYFQVSNNYIDITVKSCSIHDNDGYGLYIKGDLSTSAHISVIDTELVGNRRNEIVWCFLSFLIILLLQIVYQQDW